MPSSRSPSCLPEPSAAQPPTQALAAPAVSFSPAETAVEAAGLAARLAEANRALWSATLALMTAFMQTPAPAHRYLLARRISRNLDTLSRQDCFDARCRSSFARLARRWQARADQFAPDGPRKAAGLLRRLFS